MIVSVAVKATVVIMLAFVATLMARKSRASVRHSVFASLFVSLLILPAAAWLVPARDVELPPATPEPVSAVAQMIGPAAMAPSMMEERRGREDWNWFAIARDIYLAGAGLLLVSLGAGVWRLRRWSHGADVWIEASTIAAEVANQNGIRRAVLVVVSEEVAVPMTFGFRRQTVVMPATAHAWDEGAIRRALRHELEHVRRDDWAMQLIARVACALYWPHPLVWVAWRRFCLEAERVCDDAVLRAADASTYAEQLVVLARSLTRREPVPALAMAAPSRLSERVHAILDPRQRRGPQSRVAMIVTAALMVTVVMTFGPVRLVAAVADDPHVQAVVEGVDGSLKDLDMYRDAIIDAAAAGDVDALEELIVERRIDINTPLVGDGTPLLIAARAGRRDAVQWLLDRGADPNASSPGDGNALIAAAGASEVEIITMLLDRGARIEDIVPGDENALITAAGSASPETVRLLLDRGANPNSRAWAERGWRTPLAEARRRGHRKIERMLIAAGARGVR